MGLGQMLFLWLNVETRREEKILIFKFKLSSSFAFGLCLSPCFLVPSCTALAAWLPKDLSKQVSPPKASRALLLSPDALFSRHPSASTGLMLGRLQSTEMGSFGAQVRLQSPDPGNDEG